jgi:multidrug efflux pump subunit AcrB
MESKAHLNEVHANLITWVNELKFYKDEVKTFQSRLEEVVKQNNKPEVMAEVEHFQNQFIRQNEVIDELKHEFKQVDNQIVTNVMSNPVASDHRSMEMPAELLDQHDTFLKIYGELKVEFEKFLAKTY